MWFGMNIEIDWIKSLLSRTEVNQLESETVKLPFERGYQHFWNPSEQFTLVSLN